MKTLFVGILLLTIGSAFADDASYGQSNDNERCQEIVDNARDGGPVDVSVDGTGTATRTITSRGR